jgi:chorismate mutase
VDSVDPISNLRDIRDGIDNIVAAIIHMLAERFRRTRAVGKLKAQHGLPPSDPAREAEQVSHLRQLAAISKLDPDFAESSSPLLFVRSSDITNRFRGAALTMTLDRFWSKNGRNLHDNRPRICEMSSRSIAKRSRSRR